MNVSASGPDVSIVVPVYNEEGNLRALYEKLSAVMDGAGLTYEILMVNDGSSDRSLDIIRQLASAHPGRVRYASFSRNFGHEAASTCGFSMAGGGAAVLIDADLQDPPELIPEMFAKLREGYDAVYARRLSRRGESLLKRLTSHMFYRLMNSFSGIKLPVDVGDFRMVSRKVIDAFNCLPERKRFVRGLFYWVGFRQAELAYERKPRNAGRTKYNYTRLIFLSMDAFFSFSLAPLRLCMLLGILTTLFSFVVAGVIVVQKIFLGLTIQGYALLTAGMFLLGGVQLTFLGVLGEYIGKIYTEVQQRPLYIVSETSDGHAAKDG